MVPLHRAAGTSRVCHGGPPLAHVYCRDGAYIALPKLARTIIISMDRLFYGSRPDGGIRAVVTPTRRPQDHGFFLTMAS